MSGLVHRLSSIPFRQLRSPNLRPQANYAVSPREALKSLSGRINKKPIEETVGFMVIGLVGIYIISKVLGLALKTGKKDA